MRVRALLLLGGTLLLIGAVEPVPRPKPLDPVEGAREGRALVEKILSARPAENLTNTGVMRVREKRNQRWEIPIVFELHVTPSNSCSVYRTAGRTNAGDWNFKLTVIRNGLRPNQYTYEKIQRGAENSSTVLHPSGAETMQPFAGSDFWIADLGLEFFHWPEQRLLIREMRRGRSCRVLESINPHPAPGSYSRVVSWVDNETDGIVHAEAWDARNKVL